MVKARSTNFVQYLGTACCGYEPSCKSGLHSAGIKWWTSADILDDMVQSHASNSKQAYKVWIEFVEELAASEGHGSLNIRFK